MNKIMKLVLSLLITVTLIPTMTISADAFTVESVGDNTYISDPSTMNDYQDYFTDESTEYAGSVWTDKSVFTNTSAFNDVTHRGGIIVGDTVSNDTLLTDGEKVALGKDNFLIALSTIGSTKEIEGYETTPTDTMLVLDVSNSMDKSESVPDMIKAANDAIHRLLELNQYNRVGVVLYSGNRNYGASETSTGQVVLPLGRYKTSDTTEENGKTLYHYLKVTIGRNDYDQDTKTYLSAGLSKEDGTKVTYIEKQTTGATYTQNGMYKAYTQFKSRIEDGDTAIASGNVQGGTKRIPIYVLMTDGAPTTVASTWNAPGKSNAGNGGKTSDAFGFLNQLTASYVKNETTIGYGRDAKFYTLALNLDAQDEVSKNVAQSVLNPEKSTAGIVGHWKDLIEKGELTLSVQGTDGKDGKSITVTNKINNQTYFKAPAEGEKHIRLYVDKPFEATGVDEMIAAFNNIVEEIILQSQYYPTYVEGGKYSLDGYVTFGDELGEFMEVKNIKGMVLGNKLFTGASFAKLINDGETFGNRYTWTESGQQLLTSIQKRLNIDEQTARPLLSNVWLDEQFKYVSDTEYSNYIGWYATEDGSYISFWDKEDTDLNAPANATYRVKSYVFQGKLGDEEGRVTASDMMYIVVQVYENIQTKDQQVVWKIPSNLIPLIKYNVTINTKSLDSATDVTLTTEDAAPLRLLYEVGPREEINRANLLEYMAKEDHTHPVTKDGVVVGYAMYSNRWGLDLDSSDEVNVLDPSENLVTVSHFNPSHENERYFFIEDAKVYVKDGNGYKAYSGYTRPQNVENTYYYAYPVIERTGSGDDNAAKVTYVYLPIGSDILSDRNNLKSSGGNWYVNIGQIMHRDTRSVITKDSNPTGTLTYSDYPLVSRPEDNEEIEGYNVFSFLGNNGRIVMYSGQGIKLSKVVNDASVTETFSFEIELDQRHTRNDIEIYDEDSNPVAYTLEGGNTIKVSLQANKTITILGLKTGTKYTVSEASTEYYVLDSATVNGKEGNSGTVEEFEYDDVVFVNKKTTNKGDLLITKTVRHDYGDNYVIPNKQFTVEVALPGFENGTEFVANGTVENGQAIEKVTVSNGLVILTMGHDDSVTIKDLPRGTKFNVTETNIPEGFTLSDDSVGVNEEREIIVDGLAEAHLINKYSTDPINGNEVEIDLSKVFENWDNEVFIAKVQQNIDGEWVDVETIEFNKNNDETTVDLSDVEFTEPGTYTFRIFEVQANAGEGIETNHILFDNQTYILTLDVVDIMNGEKTIENVKLNNETVAKVEDTYNINVDFVNQHIITQEEAYADINISKVLNNNTGVEIDITQFEFGLYEGQEEVTTTNVGEDGQATIRLEYTSDDLDFSSEDTNVFTYTLKEIVPNEAGEGMDYSELVYDVIVTISKGVHGTLTSQVEIKLNEETVRVAEFTNTYTIKEPAKATIDGTKKYSKADGTTIEDASGFTFELYEANSSFEITNPNSPVTATSDTNGNFTFPEMEYETAGNRYYVVKEKAGTNPAITYSNTEYRVTVNVKDGGSGKLVAETTINEVGGNNTSIKFENIYTVIEYTSVTLGGNKQLTGKDIEDGEFTFQLFEGDELLDTTTNVGTSGNFLFDEIEYREPGVHTYTIKEDTSSPKANYEYNTDGKVSYTVVVTVTDDGEGKLSATQSVQNSEVVFTNAYNPQPIEVEFGAIKSFFELEVDENGEVIETEKELSTFEFGLYEANEEFAITNETPLQTTTNNLSGNVNMAIQITEPGTKYFVFKEIAGDDFTINYDTKAYQLTVITTQNYDNEDDVQNGALESQLLINGVDSNEYEGGMTFKNTHVTYEIEADINISKVLNNNTGVEIDITQFEFGLYEGQEEVTTTNVGEDGQATIRLEYTSDDLDFSSEDTNVFTYTLKEIVPNEAGEGMDYSELVYDVIVTISKGVHGTLTSQVEIKLNEETVRVAEFTNTYTIKEPAKATIDGTKKYSKADGTTIEDASGFTFELYEANSSFEITNPNSPVTATSDTNGNFTFPEMEYETAGNRYYVVKEKAGTNPAITYSNTEYRVTVNVKDGGSGKLVAETTINEVGGNNTSIKFENIYTVIEYTSVTLGGNKQLTGKDIEDGEFTFQLFEGDELLDTTTNVGTSGNFLFDEIEYREPGVHTYTIKEDTSSPKANYEYNTDGKVSYTVVVTVTDDGEGKLSATQSVQNSEVVFTNAYNPQPIEVEFGAIKSFFELEVDENGEVIETEKELSTFEFGLYEANEEFAITNETPLQTTTNNLSGNVNMAIQITEPGTKYFVFKEIAGDDFTINYDTKAYQLTVITTQNYDNEDDVQNGALESQLLINGVDSNEYEGGMTFKNTHVTYELDAVLDIEKQLTHNIHNVALTNFSFGLYEDIDCTIPRLYEVLEELAVRSNPNEIVLTVDETGHVTFTETYSDADMLPEDEFTFTYYVAEIIENVIPNVKYDKSVYRVDVRLYYSEENELVLEQTYTRVKDKDGVLLEVEEVVETITFINEYTGKDPKPKPPVHVVDTSTKR